MFKWMKSQSRDVEYRIENIGTASWPCHQVQVRGWRRKWWQRGWKLIDWRPVKIKSPNPMALFETDAPTYDYELAHDWLELYRAKWEKLRAAQG